MQVFIGHQLFTNPSLVGNNNDVPKKLIKNFHCFPGTIIKYKLPPVQYITQFLFVVNYPIAVQEKGPAFVNVCCNLHAFISIPFGLFHNLREYLCQ